MEGSDPIDTVPVDVDLAQLLDDDVALDRTNDLGYLLGLVGDALRSDAFDDDDAAAEWVIAQWCIEVGYTPDLRTRPTGAMVDKTDVPNDLTTELHRERRDAASASVANVEEQR